LQTARWRLRSLLLDVSSWSRQGIGSTHSPRSAQEHAAVIIDHALQDRSDELCEIARTVALPILRQRRTRPGRVNDARRNEILVDAVKLVCERHNLRPKRQSGRAESGCSIVARAFVELFPKRRLSEHALELIWDRRAR
jgi:hypothetical protein